MNEPAPGSAEPFTEVPLRPSALAGPAVWRTALGLASFSALAAGLGVLAGIGWWRVVRLSSYTVQSGGGAVTTERGLAEFISGDAWFCVLGLGVGLLLGVVGWRRFRALGWPLVLLVAAGATGAALLCWLVGHELGPEDFSGRLTAAKAGEVVPIDLTLRARASLLVWPFFAVVPVLLGSSLGRDDEEPRPLFRARRAARS